MWIKQICLQVIFLHPGYPAEERYFTLLKQIFPVIFWLVSSLIKTCLDYLFNNLKLDKIPIT